MGKSDLLEDAYRFRTPMLRNVALTAPYGHNGAYPTLEGIIRAHVEEKPNWTRELVKLPDAPWISAVDFAIQEDSREMVRQASVRDTKPINLSDDEIKNLVAFMHALTGKTVDELPFGIPNSVPSGLPLD